MNPSRLLTRRGNWRESEVLLEEMEYIVFGWVNTGFSTVSDTFNIFGDAIELSCVR